MGIKTKKKKPENDDKNVKTPLAIGFPYAPSLMTQNKLAFPFAPVQNMGQSSSSSGAAAKSSDQESLASSVPAEVAAGGTAQSALNTPPNNDKIPSNSSAVSEEASIRCIPVREGSVLLVVSKASVRYISGVCNITLLHGRTNVNGYKIKVNCHVEVRCPVWMPAARVFADIPSLSSSGQTQQEFVSQLCRAHSFLQGVRETLLTEVDSSMTILHCESRKDLVLTDWLLLAEDYAPCSSTSRLPATASSSSAAKETDPPSISLPLAAIRPAPSVVSSGVEFFALPPDWVSAVDSLCKDVKKSPVALLCGAKGVGKSTCLRYTINRLLSKASAVAVIDCDLGQPEFTPSGLVSMHILTAPVLSPPHLHLRKPELSFFLGDLSVKNMPDTFETCVAQLFAAYCRCRDAYSETGDVGLSSSAGLAPSGTERSSGNGPLCGGGYAALESNPYWKHPLPLLVNTDGWVRGMGAEVLRTVVQLTSPSHLLHITSERNSRSIPIITELQERKKKQDGDDERLEGSDATMGADIFTLTPGRQTASRLAAQDLRDLRLVSYFLRDYLSICQVSSDDSLYRGLCSVNIKNGAIVDPAGHVARALASSMQVEWPLTCFCLHALGHSLPPRLLLAVFNASLVGLSFDSPSGHTSAVQLLLPSQLSDSAGATGVRRTLLLNFVLNDSAPSPCAGLGIVADVDLAKMCMHVICTEFAGWEELAEEVNSITVPSPSSEQRVVHLSRGAIQLPTSLLFFGDMSAPCSPYMSSESYGEGSSKHGTSRSNLKRRSQNKEK